MTRRLLTVLVVAALVFGGAAAFVTWRDGSLPPLVPAVEAPGRGYHWGPEAWHATLPRGERVHYGTVGTLEQILLGPSTVPDGTMNLVGALRKAMATTGYSDVKEFQRVEVVLDRP